MLSHYLTLKLVADQLQERVNSSEVAEVFSQNRNEILISTVRGEEKFTIQASCEARTNHIFLREPVTRAKRNSIDLFPDVIGRTIIAIVMNKFDRIIEVSFDNALTLCLNFFGSRSNFYIVNNQNVIKDSFKRPRQTVGQNYETERDTPVLLSAGTDFDSFCAQFHKYPEAKNLSKALVRATPLLGSTLTRETLHRARLDPNCALDLIQSQHLKDLWETVQSVFLELRHPLPTIYFDGSTPHTFALVTLHHLSALRSHAYGDISDAIRLFVSRSHGAKSFEQAKGDIVEPLKREFEKEKRTQERMKEELESANRAAVYEKFGNLLMTKLNDVQKGMEEIEVEDVEDSQTFKIPLDPSISPVQNALTYFEKAKKARTARTNTADRLRTLDNQLKDLEEMLSQLAKCENRETLKASVDQHMAKLTQMGIVKDKSLPVEATLFRRFIVEGGFEVWAGKNSQNNDLLTMKYARQNDLWFHARGAGGSHVILRKGTGKGEPGKHAIEQAASVAAYYSHAKGSKIVPVVVAERKYVRKRRGAPEGEVILEREKMLFVEPKLPE
jgi:predicted ribosome quality control (RQC) complex YloA/Tae2 family protein